MHARSLVFSNTPSSFLGPGGENVPGNRFSSVSSEKLSAQRDQLGKLVGDLRRQFDDLTRQIDLAVEKPPEMPAMGPPTVPRHYASETSLFATPCAAPNLEALAVPSPQQFAELKRYNEAYARRSSRDPSRYSPPTPRVPGVHYNVFHVDLDPRDASSLANGNVVQPPFRGVCPLTAVSTAAVQTNAAAAPQMLSEPENNAAALDDVARGSADDGGYDSFAALCRHREALRQNIAELEKSASYCRAQFSDLTDRVDALSWKPDGVISEPAPRPRWWGQDQDEPTPPCQGATAQPVLSASDFTALRLYNHDFARRPLPQRLVYRPPFPVGRMQVGILDSPEFSPSPWSGQSVLCLYGGEVPVAVSASARRIELQTEVAQAEDGAEPSYPQVAQLYSRREEVGRLIVDNISEFSDVVDAIRAHDLQSINPVFFARPSGGL